MQCGKDASWRLHEQCYWEECYTLKSRATAMPRAAEMDVEECPAPKGSYSLSSLFVKPANVYETGLSRRWLHHHRAPLGDATLHAIQYTSAQSSLQSWMCFSDAKAAVPTRQAPCLPNGRHAASPACQNFVAIGLVANIPDNLQDMQHQRPVCVRTWTEHLQRWHLV